MTSAVAIICSEMPRVVSIVYSIYVYVSVHTWYPKHPLVYSCVSWMIPNHYLKKTADSPFPSIQKNDCIDSTYIYIYIYIYMYIHVILPLWVHYNTSPTWNCPLKSSVFFTHQLSPVPDFFLPQGAGAGLWVGFYG